MSEPNSPFESLGQLLNEADACSYVNPFTDSVNAGEFGKYAYKIRDLDRALDAKVKECERLKASIKNAIEELDANFPGCFGAGQYIATLLREALKEQE